MSTRGDLAMLARLESVEAVSTSAADHSAGSVPQWSELVLAMESEEGGRIAIPFTRHDAELVIQVLHEVLHPNTHQTSVVQRLWSLLDDTMDFLMADDSPEPEDKSRARALAEAIAMLTQPYSEEPDVAAIRTMAVERWEERESSG